MITRQAFRLGDVERHEPEYQAWVGCLLRHELRYVGVSRFRRKVEQTSGEVRHLTNDPSLGSNVSLAICFGEKIMVFELPKVRIEIKYDRYKTCFC